MSIKTSNFIGYLAVLVLLSACQSPTQNNENITISKASILPLSSPQKTKETIAFFYSYNSNNSKLEWTAMELKESSNNKLQDAINAFIIYYQKAGVGDQLELKSVEKYNNIIF